MNLRPSLFSLFTNNMENEHFACSFSQRTALALLATCPSAHAFILDSLLRLSTCHICTSVHWHVFKHFKQLYCCHVLLHWFSLVFLLAFFFSLISLFSWWISLRFYLVRFISSQYVDYICWHLFVLRFHFSLLLAWSIFTNLLPIGHTRLLMYIPTLSVFT